MTRRFLYLNGISIISVVLFHAAGMGFVAMFAWGSRYLPEGVPPLSQVGSLPYYFLRLLEQIVPFCIPAFLLVSGYFIAAAKARSQNTVSWAIVFSRIRILSIPYLIWTAVIIGLKLLEGRSFDLDVYLRFILLGQSNEVMYFVPLLLQFYLLSPFLIRLVNWNWKATLLTVGIFQVIQILTVYPMLIVGPDTGIFSLSRFIPKWLFLSRLFWFTAGIVFGLHRNAIFPAIKRYRAIFAWLAILLIPIGMIEWEWLYHWSGQDWLSSRETLIDTVYSAAVILGYLGYNDLKLPLVALISDWGAKSYGIYLIHAIVIETFSRVIYRFIPAILGVQYLYIPLIIVLGLGVPLLMMWIVDRSPVRKVYHYLFG
jgi:peptidoglycan/LPS O-acetylase OafA/YrhL